jgi:hypothetical protein
MAEWDRDRDRERERERYESGREFGRDRGYGRDFGRDFGSDFGRDQGRDFGREGYRGGWTPETWSGGSSTGYGGQYGGQYGRESEGRYSGGYEPREADRYERGREGAGLWDRVKRGLHIGKGPKGYRRADERIHEDVCDMLERDPDIDATEVVVVVQGGEVTLDGSVDDRWAKRHAEDVIEGLPGVKDVHNRLRVAPRSGTAASAGSSTGITAEMPATDQTPPRGRSTTTRNR